MAQAALAHKMLGVLITEFSRIPRNSGSLTLSCKLPVTDVVSERTLLMTLGSFAFHASSIHEYDPDYFLKLIE
jgi:hypothetical protein